MTRFKDREFDRTARMTESGKACMYKNKTLIVIFIGILVIAIVLGISFFSEKTETQIIPQSNSQENDNADVSIVTQNLEIPWEIVFLPDSRMLVTERPGRVRIISRDGNLNPSPVATISEVKHIGEGGLLGIAIHPEFAGNQYVYLYYTYTVAGLNSARTIFCILPPVMLKNHRKLKI
ncbi:MAG: Quinoprotein glucose dehydrogenase [Candidatus Curtissbacteria bacterium GW2011_GWA2_40_31]|nr:MAG: Quinoprotein glucose dehydrogenase [Candidatus Curtissbacteria bacterium GW2011_GWA2_40_31]